VASALSGEAVRSSANLLEEWLQYSRSPVSFVLQSARSLNIDDHEQGLVYSPQLEGSRSSLSVPLLEGKQVTGVLHVESSQPRHYSERRQSQLEILASEAMLAIDRLSLREQIAQAGGPIDLVGVSAAFLELQRQIKQVAHSASSSVLVTGERGCGKELTAWAIHAWSRRRNRAFVPVLASALAESLYADELFGHERHAFTGAGQQRSGKFQAADGGTLFFDEVGDMPSQVQVALLRVLERGELQRVGRDSLLRIDVRVLAATNQSLSELIAQGQFRADLYDRLSAIEIWVPPLRERREDIPLLASYFLRKFCKETQRQLSFLDEATCATCPHFERSSCATPEFYEALQSYDWPGNVRELKNNILRVVTVAPGEIVDVKHLPEHIQRSTVNATKPAAEELSLDATIKSHIERVLRMTDYNQSKAAEVLSLPLSTLRNKMKRLGVKVRKP